MLILSDINMSGMSGLQLVENVKKTYEATSNCYDDYFV